MCMKWFVKLLKLFSELLHKHFFVLVLFSISWGSIREQFMKFKTKIPLPGFALRFGVFKFWTADTRRVFVFEKQIRSLNNSSYEFKITDSLLNLLKWIACLSLLFVSHTFCFFSVLCFSRETFLTLTKNVFMTWIQQANCSGATSLFSVTILSRKKTSWGWAGPSSAWAGAWR